MINDFSVRMRYAEPPSLGEHQLGYTEQGSCYPTKQNSDGESYRRSELANAISKGSFTNPTIYPDVRLQESTHA